MLELPSKNNFHLQYNKIIKYHEPTPQIGNTCTCKVVKVSPVHAALLVLKIEDQTPSITYKAILRAPDLQLNIMENQFVWDVMKINSIVEVVIVGYGDNNGMNVVLKK